MKYALILTLFLSGCTTGPVLTIQDRAGLGAYLAFHVVTAAPAPAPTPTPDDSSDVCGECNGRGKQGDGTICFTCSACNGTGKKQSSMPIVEPPKAAMPVAKPKVSYQTGPHWNVEGKWNYTTLELADHLRRVHGVNINGMTRAELERVHDNLHNYGEAMVAPSASSCPNGRCPTSPPSRRR